MLHQAIEPPNNKVWVGISAGAAALIFLLAALRKLRTDSDSLFGL